MEPDIITPLPVYEIGIRQLIRNARGGSISHMMSDDENENALLRRIYDSAEYYSSATYWEMKCEWALSRFRRAMRYRGVLYSLYPYLYMQSQMTFKQRFFYYMIESLHLCEGIHIVARNPQFQPAAFLIRNPERCDGALDCLFVEEKDSLTADQKSEESLLQEAITTWGDELNWFICTDREIYDSFQSQGRGMLTPGDGHMLIPHPRCLSDAHAPGRLFVYLKNGESLLEFNAPFHLQIDESDYRAQIHEILRNHRIRIQKWKEAQHQLASSPVSGAVQEGGGRREAERPARVRPARVRRRHSPLPITDQGEASKYWTQKNDIVIEQYDRNLALRSETRKTYLSRIKPKTGKSYFYYTIENLALERAIEILKRGENDSPIAFVIHDSEKCREKFECFFVKEEEIERDSATLNQGRSHITKLKVAADLRWRERLGWFICARNSNWRLLLGTQSTDDVKRILFTPYPYCFTDEGARGRVFIYLDPRNIPKIPNGIGIHYYHARLSALLDENKRRSSTGDGGRPVDRDGVAPMPETEIDGGLPGFDSRILDGLLGGGARSLSES
jgi:hypothetical protein